MNCTIKYIGSVLLLMLILSCEKKEDEKALPYVRYKVTFNAFWSSKTHPNSFPPGPHFSGLIGATHKNEDVLFMPGNLASEGIQVMAEVGGKTPLEYEINELITKKKAEYLLSGGGISKSPGAVSLDFEIGPDFPLVTLVSMLAPSPDWFIAVRNISLTENREWVTEKTVEVNIWDAGTDSGSTYTSPNAEELPRKNITPIQTPPLAVDGKVSVLGELVFELLPTN